MYGWSTLHIPANQIVGFCVQRFSQAINHITNKLSISLILFRSTKLVDLLPLRQVPYLKLRSLTYSAVKQPFGTVKGIAGDLISEKR